MLTIREPIGELRLKLDGDTLSLEPSRSFRHVVAERRWKAEAFHRVRRGPLDGTVARVHGTGSGDRTEIWGAFPLAACEVTLKGSRLHLRVNKFQMSFSPTSFDAGEANLFVRQFCSARADLSSPCVSVPDERDVEE